MVLRKFCNEITLVKDDAFAKLCSYNCGCQIFFRGRNHCYCFITFYCCTYFFMWVIKKYFVRLKIVKGFLFKVKASSALVQRLDLANFFHLWQVQQHLITIRTHVTESQYLCPHVWQLLTREDDDHHHHQYVNLVEMVSCWDIFHQSRK